AFGDARILGRACAALRLAVRRTPLDASLLERVGESFLEYGDPARAEKTFRRALEIDGNALRAQTGLAEVALSEGKLAHVIHHYNEAVRIAPDKATKRLALREADYYSRLNNDEDYLAAELRRMNWLEGAGRVQRLTARVSFAALLIALAGASVDQLLASFGWALASSSLIGWSGALIMKKFLGTRRRAQARDAGGANAAQRRNIYRIRGLMRKVQWARCCQHLAHCTTTNKLLQAINISCLRHEITVLLPSPDSSLTHATWKLFSLA